MVVKVEKKSRFENCELFFDVAAEGGGNGLDVQFEAHGRVKVFAKAVDL